MLIGYARVSTDDQTLDLQRDALLDAGCERIFEDHASGAGDRPGLRDALTHLRAGDALVVWRLDRLGRSLKDLIARAETLTPAQFRGLAALPAEAEWLANIRNDRTRRAYRHDVEAFCRFAGIATPEAMRSVTRPHVIAWRTHLEQQGLAGASIRRKLSALASLFDHLCECNVAADNPVRGVQRPPIDALEGKTPALSDAQGPPAARRTARGHAQGAA